MAKFNKTLTDFSFGVLSRKMAGRIDTDNYQKGLSDSLNFLGMPTGGVIKRPGSRYLFNLQNVSDGLASPTYYNMNDSAIFPFYHTNGNRYIVVCNFEDSGNIVGRLQILSNAGVQQGYSVISSPSLNFSNANLWAIQSGNFLIIGDTRGLAQPCVVYVITYADGTNAFYVSNWIDVTTAYIRSQYLTYPFLDRNISATTLTPSATSGTITLSSSAALFTASHVGAMFRIIHGTTEGVCIVTAFTNSTTVTASVSEAFGAATASTSWAESAWSDHKGWPRSACFFNQRACFGGSYSKPDTIWCSMVGNIFHMMQAPLLQNQGSSDVAADGFFSASTLGTFPASFAIAANRSNIINWMSAKDVLAVGTVEEEYVISDINPAQTPTAVVKQQTAIGSKPHQAISVGDSIIYINRNGKELYNFKYNDSNGSFISNSLNILNDAVSEYAVSSLSRSRAYIRKIVWQESRNTIWAITSDSDLLSCTVTSDLKTAGWFKHFIKDNSNIVGNVLDIMVLSDSGIDTLFLVKRRVIDSTTKCYIETIGDDFKESSLYSLSFTYPSDEPLFLDCGISLDAPITTTLNGLSHLKGETINIVAEGNQLSGTFVVNASGQVTLPAIYTGRLQAGYLFPSYFQTMDLEAGKESEDAVGTTKRMDRAFIKFWQTREGNIGSSSLDLVPITFANTTVLYSGDKKELLNHTPEEQCKIYISQSYAYPMCILSVTIRGVTYD